MKKHAFTLIELLVVVAIIAVLIAILLPVINQARERARTLMCLSTLKQFEVAQNYYANESNGWFAAANGWVINTLFRSYLHDEPRSTDPLDWQTGRWVKRLACAKATYAFSESSIGGYVYMPYSYGANYYVYPNYSWVNWYQRDKIPNPSAKLHMADALNQMIHGNHSHLYSDWWDFTEYPAQKYGYVPIAYRHSRSANITYFDGHAATLDYRTIIKYNPQSARLWQILD